MIKFFRHIRQRLVIDNRFSKYFLYAIGEIILVVIGILIALSINNWNEKRIDKIKEHYYLKSLRADLHKQQQEFEDAIDWETETRDEAKEIINYFNKNGDFTSMEDIYFKFNKSIFRNVPTYFTSTLDELSSTGNIALISNDSLRTALAEYYKNIKSQQKNYESNIYNLIDQQITPILSRYSIMNYHTLNVEDIITNVDSTYTIGSMNKDLIKTANEQLANAENSLLIYNHINLRFLIAQVQIDANEYYIGYTNEILHIIEKEIGRLESTFD